MITLETKQSGFKLPHHSEFRVGGKIPGEASPRRQRGMKIGTSNVRSLYRAGSLKAAARELVRYKLDIVGVQEVRWDKEGTVRAEDYDCFYWKENENHQLGTGFFVHRRLVSAVKRVEFVSGRLSYIVLKGRWHNIIVVNVHATSEEKVMRQKLDFMRN